MISSLTRFRAFSITFQPDPSDPGHPITWIRFYVPDLLTREESHRKALEAIRQDYPNVDTANATIRAL